VPLKLDETDAPIIFTRTVIVTPEPAPGEQITLNLSDTAGALDAATSIRHLRPVDSSSASDSVTLARALSATSIEQTDASDAIRLTILHVVADSAGLSDVVAQALIASRSLLDSAGADDAIVRTLNTRAADSVEASDAARLTASRSVSDVVGSTDAVALRLAVTLAFTDVIVAADGAALAQRKYRSFTDEDAAGAADTATFNGLPAFPYEWDTWASDLGYDTVQVLDAPLAAGDRHGARKRDWTRAVTTTVPRCSVQPYAATETTTDREFTSTHVRLFAPPGAPMKATGRVVHNGITYDVDGEPATWRDLDGRPSHVEVALKRLTG
jgi:hypothetical protein